jgi:predicted DNA-binding transcriptional regulator AlpA
MRHKFPSPVILPAADTVIEHRRLIAALGVSRALLHKWRKERGFPPFIRDGRNSFSIISDVEKWLECNGIEYVRT